MKFIRILPEIWAKTLCPFSNSTRNMAFGNGSTTMPSTSMASSLAILVIPPLLSSPHDYALPKNPELLCHPAVPQERPRGRSDASHSCASDDQPCAQSHLPLRHDCRRRTQ